MMGAKNIEDEYDIPVTASESDHYHHLHHYLHHQDPKRGTIAADNAANDENEIKKKPSNKKTFDVIYDGDDLDEMTENNLKSESDENGPIMQVESPTKPKLDTKDPLRPRRKKARRACYACQRAHLTCGDERPCQRCIKRGLADVCQDGIRKKAKYLHDAPSDALRPVLGPYYKSNFNQTANHSRSISGNNNSIARDSSNTSPSVTTSTRMSSIFSLQSTPSYSLFNQSNPIPPPLQARISMNSQKSTISPSFNHQTNSISNNHLSSQQISSNDVQRASFNAGATLFDANNPNFYGFDLESLNFGNHYGALEFGILGHMSSGVEEVSLKDQPGFMSVQGLGEVNFNDNCMYGDSMSNCNQMYQNDLLNFGSVPENQIFSSQTDLQHAYAIAAGSQSHYSPSTDASSSATGTYENSPITTSFTPNSTPYIPTPKSIKPTKSRSAGTSNRLGFGSNPLRKRSRDSSFIYDSVKEPYPYTTGFHNLTAFLQRRFSSTETFRIAKSLASIRPSFISCMKTLNRQDLIFMEKCFQRTLFEYESFMHHCCTPTLVCRRTGEITAVNQEFTMMTGWRKDVLLGKEPNLNINTGKSTVVKTSEHASGATTRRVTFVASQKTQQEEPKSNTIEQSWKDFETTQQPVLLAELMDANDVIEFYQDFARLAFNDSRGSIMGRCKLLKYIANEKECENENSQSPKITATIANSTISELQSIDLGTEKLVTSINGKRKRDLILGGNGSDYGLRELNGSSSFERDGKIDCCYCWTVKRDVFDIPMMIILNFLPCT
ncbi:Transcription activator of gluconeogenesis [Erysiphe necator]|nr:Transcription activator of gluconeogenesis [Erysiphe necator]